MASIVGNAHGETLRGSSGGDRIEARGGRDELFGNDVGGGELLSGGSFESAKIADGTWGTVAAVGGWRTDTSIEVWGKDFLGVDATDGSKVVELDFDRRVSKLWQDVQTEAGKAYAFSFDFSARAGTASATNSIEVYWNGERVGTFEPTSATWETGRLELLGTGGLDRLEFREQAGDNDSVGGLIDNVSLKDVSDGRDELIGGRGADLAYGGGGDDLIFGGGRPGDGLSLAVAGIDDNDTLHAGDGDDIVHGNHGDDIVYGDNGNDNLFGGRGDDQAHGGTGSDRLLGNSGNDTLHDGSGDDVVHGGSGNDVLVAGSGIDAYVGGSGVDMLTFVDALTGVRVNLSKHIASGLGGDTIHGIEHIEGSNFADYLKGSKWDETLSGGAGNDVIRGLGGADVLIGGDGSDIFHWKIADLKRDAETRAVDVVKDMTLEDRIDLRDLAVGMTLEPTTLQVSFDGADTRISANVGDGMRDFVVLENFKAESVEQLVREGILLV